MLTIRAAHARWIVNFFVSNMTIVVKKIAGLVVPASLQRQAGIKAGDRLEVKASPRTITITAVEPACKPSKAELAAIREGEEAIARGQSVSLTEFLHGLDRNHRKTGTKASRKVSR
jgi:bifunctional DNA-binding transcriptional regulator/antitoxin component of YhaV-PrlF toxin-antitoxin module